MWRGAPSTRGRADRSCHATPRRHPVVMRCRVRLRRFASPGPRARAERAHRSTPTLSRARLGWVLAASASLSGSPEAPLWTAHRLAPIARRTPDVELRLIVTPATAPIRVSAVRQQARRPPTSSATRAPGTVPCRVITRRTARPFRRRGPTAPALNAERERALAPTTASRQAIAIRPTGAARRIARRRGPVPGRSTGRTAARSRAAPRPRVRRLPRMGPRRQARVRNPLDRPHRSRARMAASSAGLP